MKNNLIITKKEDVVYYGYFQDGNAAELYCEKWQQQSLMGNIYVARVERIADGIDSAFLELSDGQKAYFSTARQSKPVKLSPGHEDRLYGGDLILVQIGKDAVKTKLPVADANVSLTGKYFVLTLADKRSGISKKIVQLQERERLEDLTKAFHSEDFGIITRTNAKGVQDHLLKEELLRLTARYEELMRRASISPGRELLYKEPAHYLSFARELPQNALEEIVTDCPEIMKELRAYFQANKDEEGERKLRLYEDSYSLSKLYRLEHFYKKARERLVHLKSGGSIVIEQTEAMVVIDVNTGHVTKGKKAAQELFCRINLEAAEEIVRQLRLRNLSGMIVVDFINMKKREQQEQLMQHLKEECKKDRIPAHVIDITALNLVEMTRNKVRRPLHEQWKLCHEKAESVLIL